VTIAGHGRKEINKMADHIIVRYLDPDGGCRAWASGPVKDRLEIRELADKHLAEYRIEKLVVGDPLATAEYTMIEERLAI
jgi:hypothetical protein